MVVKILAGLLIFGGTVYFASGTNTTTVTNKKMIRKLPKPDNLGECYIIRPTIKIIS